MELKEVEEIIKTLDAIEGNPACKQLSQNLNALLDCHCRTSNGPAGSDVLEEFQKRLEAFWSSFDVAVEGFGFSPEILKANLNNPDFFEPDQWKAIQVVQQSIMGETETGSMPAKLKRNNKKLRV